MNLAVTAAEAIHGDGPAATTASASVIGGQRWSKEAEMMESWLATAPNRDAVLMAPCEGGEILPDSCSDCRREGTPCAIADLAQQGVSHASNAGEDTAVERRRDLATAQLPLDVECALEHAAVALDQVRQRVVAVIQQHMPPATRPAGYTPCQCGGWVSSAGEYHELGCTAGQGDAA